jgi:hypothetical protein
MINADVFFQLFVSNALEQVINLVLNGSTTFSKVLVGRVSLAHTGIGVTTALLLTQPHT